MSATFHLLVLHPDEARALAVAGVDGPALPSMTPAEPFFALTEEVVAFAAEQLGVQATVLRCLAQQRDGDALQAVMVLEPHGDVPLPTGGRWVGCEAVDDLPLPEILRAAVGACLAEEADPARIHPLRAPWAVRGWRSRFETWVRDALAGEGYDVRGVLEQRKQWGITSLWRARTDRGFVYAKATPPLMHAEAGVTRLLAGWFPESIPQVVAADTARGWLLLEDFGGEVLGRFEGGENVVGEVARGFAAMQTATVARGAALLAAGAADRRQNVLAVQLPTLLHESEELGYLEDSARDALGRLEPAIRRWLAELAACGLPDTLLHGDLHFGNVARTPRGLVYFDWTDASVGPPLFDLTTLSYRLEPKRKHALVDGYLASWREVVPAGVLERALALAEGLGHLHHAASYGVIRKASEPSARWELGGTMAHHLKAFVCWAIRQTEGDYSLR